MDQQDRRQHERHLHSEGVFCYVDGSRFDASSLDISRGGLFIRTDSDVPIGATLALVFQPEYDPDSPPIFLVGKVVRKTDQPRRGIGLQWIRALTESPRAELVRFLTTKLGLSESEVRLEEYGPLKKIRSIYEFPTTSPSGPEPGVTAPKGAPAFAVPETGPAPEKQEQAPGPMTAVINATSTMVTVKLEALAVLDGEKTRCQVVGLSIDALLLRVGTKPRGYSESVPVLFTVPAKQGLIKISCRCLTGAFRRSEDGVGFEFELTIRDLDEGDHPGVLKTYIKWALHKSLQASA